jgi:hypothetical protein
MDINNATEERQYLRKEVAEILGITTDAVRKLAVRFELGRKKVGMWWFTEDELTVMKNNCRKYLLAQREA